MDFSQDNENRHDFAEDTLEDPILEWIKDAGYESTNDLCDQMV